MSFEEYKDYAMSAIKKQQAITWKAYQEIRSGNVSINIIFLENTEKIRGNSGEDQFLSLLSMINQYANDISVFDFDPLNENKEYAKYTYKKVIRLSFNKQS